MIDRDFITEVWDTIVKQRWRSLMTAFGVFWGILILTILIGAGKGLQNGLYATYKAMPSNSVIAMTSPTLLSYAGFEAGRPWNLTVSDMEKLNIAFSSDIKDISMLNLANDGVPVPVKCGDLVTNYVMIGQQPGACGAFPQKMLEGRFINERDMEESRSVCVIGNNVAEQLFGAGSPLGKGIQVDGKEYIVVGVVKRSSDKIDLGFNLSESVVIPLSLMQKSYNQGDAVHICNIVLYDNVDANTVTAGMDAILRERHSLHPDDNSALMLVCFKQAIKQVDTIFGGINFLIWVVGLGTLIAGLIGISNIMMITVKERTKEIGIRTAMGAQPQSIVGQIMCESMVLSAVSGLAGLCLGVGALALLNRLLGEGSDSFTHPYIPFWIGIISLLILIAGGLLAGLIPARRALKIELVKALSDE